MKRLFKTETDKKISGVCAGIAKYFNIDPVVIRVGFVFVTVVTGIVPGIFAYIIMAWVMPKESEVK